MQAVPFFETIPRDCNFFAWNVSVLFQPYLASVSPFRGRKRQLEFYILLNLIYT